jgi:Leucine-rich repeat (LRR) protein
VTNRDKKDSIRGRMADAGEPFNVARRKVEAAAAGPVSEAEFQEIKRTGRYDLSNRELTALPAEIGQLTSLRELALDGNRLTTLPWELADLLSGGLELGLAGNPLQGPILELYGQGPQALASHLRGLE